MKRSTFILLCFLAIIAVTALVSFTSSRPRTSEHMMTVRVQDWDYNHHVFEWYSHVSVQQLPEGYQLGDVLSEKPFHKSVIIGIIQ